MLRTRFCSLCIGAVKLAPPLNRSVPLPRRSLYTPNDGLDRQGSYEGTGKTTVSILNQDLQGVNLIDSYSEEGFRLNDNSLIIGPAVVFPTAVLRWGINSAAEITEESLSLFTLLDPRPDLVVVGHGGDAKVRDPVNIRTILAMKKKGISIEVLRTEKAISTYNYLVEEGRVAAAALIPPAYVKVLEDHHLIETKVARDELYVSDVNYLGQSRSERKTMWKRERENLELLDKMTKEEK